MKKGILLMICSWQLFAFSQKTSFNMPESGDCPPGYSPGISIYIETLNFHKPRTNCNRLFGFCLRIHVNASCIPDYQKSAINENKMEITGLLREKEVVLYIPKVVSELYGFDEKDAQTFELEDHMLEIEYPDGSVKFAKTGNYPVVLENEAYTIRIPIE